jgi:uncharacterized phage protein gp47/JayE
MAGEFFKTFDELMQNILTDYTNLDPSPDTSVGSVVFIKAACLASALWGLYRYQDYIARQIFPDTSDTENLEHHGTVLGLARLAGEVDSDYLTRILAFLRKPPAGGNKYDYISWTKQYSDGSKIVTTTNLDPDGNPYYVGTAQCYPAARGSGTVDVVIRPISSGGYVVPAAAQTELFNLVYSNIDELRPVTSNQFTLSIPTDKQVNLNVSLMAPSGVVLDTVAIKNDIIGLINGLAPGETLYKTRIICVCTQRGAISVTLSPDGDIYASTTSGSYEVLVPGNITVTA